MTEKEEIAESERDFLFSYLFSKSLQEPNPDQAQDKARSPDFHSNTWTIHHLCLESALAGSCITSWGVGISTRHSGTRHRDQGIAAVSQRPSTLSFYLLCRDESGGIPIYLVETFVQNITAFRSACISKGWRYTYRMFSLIPAVKHWEMKHSCWRWWWFCHLCE